MEVLKKVESFWLSKDQKGLSRNWLVRKFFRSYRKRAGCVVLQKIEDQIMVLLIGSIEKVNTWKLPGIYLLISSSSFALAGGIEDGETEFVAAARETVSFFLLSLFPLETNLSSRFLFYFLPV